MLHDAIRYWPHVRPPLEVGDLGNLVGRLIVRADFDGSKVPRRGKLDKYT